MASPSRIVRQQRSPDRPVVVPYGVRLAAEWSWRLIVIAVAAAGLLWLAARVSVVSIAVVVAILLTALLAPLAKGFRELGLPSLLAAGSALLVGLVAVVGLFALAGQRMVASLADLQEQALDGMTQVQTWLTDGPLGIDEHQLAVYVEQVREQVSSNSGVLVSGALTATTTLGHVVTGFFLALFATLFFLGDGQRIWGWFLTLMPQGSRERADGAGRRAWVTLTAYIRATILVATVDALGIGLGALLLLGPSLALPITVLVFLTAFMPIIGAIVSGAVAVLVALVTQGPVVALVMLVVVIAVQQLENHVLQPFMLGRAVSVHPLGVALAVATGIFVAGVVGALFAVPVVAVLNTVGRYLSGRDETAGDEEAMEELAPTASAPPPTPGDHAPRRDHARPE